MVSFDLRQIPAAAVFVAIAAASIVSASSVKTTACNGQTYTYQELAGYGYFPSYAVDRYGDTMSFGSSIALDKATWTRKANNVYEGILYSLPG